MGVFRHDGEIPPLSSFFYLRDDTVGRLSFGLASGFSPKGRPPCLRTGSGPPELLRGQAQVGSLTGAVHPSKRNAGVLRLAHGGQKPPVEQKGKSQLDPDLQYGYGP